MYIYIVYIIHHHRPSSSSSPSSNYRVLFSLQPESPERSTQLNLANSRFPLNFVGDCLNWCRRFLCQRPWGRPCDSGRYRWAPFKVVQGNPEAVARNWFSGLLATLPQLNCNKLPWIPSSVLPSTRWQCQLRLQFLRYSNALPGFLLQRWFQLAGMTSIQQASSSSELFNHCWQLFFLLSQTGAWPCLPSPWDQFSEHFSLFPWNSHHHTIQEDRNTGNNLSKFQLTRCLYRSHVATSWAASSSLLSHWQCV